MKTTDKRKIILVPESPGVEEEVGFLCNRRSTEDTTKMCSRLEYDNRNKHSEYWHPML